MKIDLGKFSIFNFKINILDEISQSFYKQILRFNVLKKRFNVLKKTLNVLKKGAKF